MNSVPGCATYSMSVFIAVVLSAVFAKGHALRTWCQAGQTGQSCYINCIFSEGVKGKNFVFIKYGNSNESPEDVLYCFYKGETTDCFTAPGYTFSVLPGNEQTLVIPEAQKTFEGQYVCQYHTQDHQTNEPCYLEIQENPTTRIQDGSDNDDHDKGSLVTAAIVVIVGVVIYRKKGCWRRKHWACKLEEGKSPANEAQTPLRVETERYPRHSVSA